MQSVKVRRTGISAEDAAAVLRDGLGIATRTASAIGEAVAFRDDG